MTTYVSGAWDIRVAYDDIVPAAERAEFYELAERWARDRNRQLIPIWVRASWFYHNGAWELRTYRIAGPVRTSTGKPHAINKRELVYRRRPHSDQVELDTAPEWLRAWATAHGPETAK